MTEMITRTSDTELLNWTGDTLGIGIFEDAVELKDDLATLDQKYGGVFSEVIAEEEFTGKANTTVVIRVGTHSPIRKVIFIGLGKVDTLKLETLRIAGATLARTAKKQKAKTLGISFPIYNNQPAATAQAITEGAHLALYQDIRFKSEPEDKNPSIETIDLLNLSGQQPAITRAEQIVSGVILARELVAAPANALTPITMAQTAQAIAQEHGLELKNSGTRRL